MKRFYNICREDVITGSRTVIYSSTSRDNALSWLRYFRDTNKCINHRFWLEG